jgi:hypothetical protein
MPRCARLRQDDLLRRLGASGALRCGAAALFARRYAGLGARAARGAATARPRHLRLASLVAGRAERSDLGARYCST